MGQQDDAKERPGRDWYSRAEICAFHGVTEQTFDRTYRPLMPESGVRRAGIRSWYNGPAYLEAVIAYKVRVATKREGAGGGAEDGGLGGGAVVDAEAAKRLIRAKAQEQELKVGQLLRRLVPIEELRPLLMECADDLRRAGEMLQRQFGSEASSVINEVIDEWVRRWAKAFHGPNGDRVIAPGDGGAVANASAPDDAGVR